jgi:hypothetical protein
MVISVSCKRLDKHNAEILARAIRLRKRPRNRIRAEATEKRAGPQPSAAHDCSCISTIYESCDSKFQTVPLHLFVSARIGSG